MPNHPRPSPCWGRGEGRLAVTPTHGKWEAEEEGSWIPLRMCPPRTASDTGPLWRGPPVSASTFSPDGSSLFFWLLPGGLAPSRGSASRPTRPQVVQDQLWSFLKPCWGGDKKYGPHPRETLMCTKCVIEEISGLLLLHCSTNIY